MDQNRLIYQAMIYLAAMVVMVPVSKKMGLGSVLGYLLAGILIGPSVLNLISNQGENIMHVAEFGVVMMLFIIGLELEPELLWKMRKSIVGLGGLQVLVTGCCIAGIVLLLGFNWRVAVTLGMILSLSSTAIVLQTLNEKSLMKTAAGQSSFSVLLFQDIAVIPMLALLPLLAPYHTAESDALTKPANTWVGSLPGWGQTLVVLGTVVAIILSGRFLIRPLLRIIAATQLREAFTAMSLFLVIGIAVLMEQVGLSPALGTFLAGVVLANSEYKHELESDIDPFKGLLLGLFFLSVGASINFELILQQPWLILGLVLMLMVVKGLVLFTLGKVFRMGTDQNMLFAFALSQTGEFAFILFSFSAQHNILSTSMQGIMVAVVAISMAFTPLAMLIYEKLLRPRTGTRERVEEREADNINEENPVIIAGFGHFGNIVGRFLRAHQINATILDIDSDRVDVLRKMGFKVYYGDASRHDLLKAAGADHAKLIIIALEPPEKRLEMIETIKKHFPHLRMLVRAQNRYDAYKLMNAGMMHVYRESVDTSIRMGVDAMKMLGYRLYSAQRSARTFLHYDEKSLKKLAAIRDEKQYIITSREYIEELEKIIQAEKMEVDLHEDSGWDEESLIADAKGGQP